MLELKVVYSIRVVSFSALSGILGMPTSNLNSYIRGFTLNSDKGSLLNVNNYVCDEKRIGCIVSW